MSIRWPRLLTPTHLSQIISTQKNPLTALRIFNQANQKYPNYRHNGPVYATMITILASSGRVNEMSDVIDQMKEEFCPCKDSVFVTAIKTYASSGMLCEATSLFRNLKQFNCVNWNESFNTLLEIMVRESKLEAAHRLYLESSHGWEVKSRVKSLNLLMGSLCKNGDSLLALQVFQEMDFQGCHPDRQSYEILMKGLCDEKKLHEAIHVLYSMFWRISQKGSGEDIVVYRTLLNALCDDGQVEEALEILGKILRKGLKAPSRRLLRLDLTHDGKDIENTKRLINNALINGVVPSLDSYNAMAFDLYNEGNIVEAERVLHVMREKRFWPSISIYESKALALCREGRVSEAVKIIEDEIPQGSRVPTVKLYNIIIKGLCDTGSSETAIGYLKKMSKQVGCVADKNTYDILVDELCRDGRFVDASRVLEEMLIKSYSPCVSICNVLIRGLCSIGKQYEAAIWLEEMISQSKQPELSTWNSLIGSACSNRFWIDLSRKIVGEALSAAVIFGRSVLIYHIDSCRPEELRIPFERYGIVRDVYIPKDYYTQEPRGFAFVQFVEPYAATEAQHHMNGRIFAGREISVVVALETRKRPEEMRHRDRDSREPYEGRQSYYGSRSRSRSRSPHIYTSRSQYHSRSYSPAIRRRDYSVSPGRKRADYPRSPRAPSNPRDGDQNRRSYSPPGYGNAADQDQNGNGYGKRRVYEPEDTGRAQWRLPTGRASSRSPSRSRSRSVDLSPGPGR